MNALEVLGLATVILLLIVVHLMARRKLRGEGAPPKKRTGSTNGNYAAQGCLFVLVCVGIGWLIATVIPKTSGSSALDPHPSWLFGSWSQKGTCAKDDALYFEFDPSGRFSMKAAGTAEADLSGDYSVEANLIKLENLAGSEEALKAVGGTSGEIEYTRDTTTDDVKFKGNSVDRCSEVPTQRSGQ